MFWEMTGQPFQKQSAGAINGILEYSDRNGKKWFMNIPAALRQPSHEAYSAVNHSVTGQQVPVSETTQN